MSREDLFAYEVQVTGYWDYGLVLFWGSMGIGLLLGLLRWQSKRFRPFIPKYHWISCSIGGATVGTVMGAVLFLVGFATQSRWRTPMKLIPEMAALNQACKDAGLKTSHTFAGWAGELPAELFSEELRRYWEAKARYDESKIVVLELDLMKEKGMVIWAQVFHKNGLSFPHPFLRLPGAEEPQFPDTAAYYYRNREPTSIARDDLAIEAIVSLTNIIKAGDATPYLISIVETRKRVGEVAKRQAELAKERAELELNLKANR